MASVCRFLTTRLQLKVNESKSAVARSGERKFLGFTISNDPEPTRQIAAKALEKFKERVRELTSRTLGVSVPQLIAPLARYLIGWRGYFLRHLLTLGRRRALLLSGLLHGLWHMPLLLLTPFYHGLGNRWIVVPLFLLTLTAAGVVYGCFLEGCAHCRQSAWDPAGVERIRGVSATGTAENST
jgi:hypothetical protein